MKNKTYKLSVLAREVQDRNIREDVYPERFKMRETREMYLARTKKK